MRICVLDGYGMNPGDLSWSQIEAFGELVIHDRVGSQDLVELSQGFDALLTNKVEISDHHMAQLPELKYIGVTATGYNIVDVAAAKERGIVVTNVPGYSTASVPQFVFAYILEWASRVYQHNMEVHDGAWARSPDFSFTSHPLVEVAGLTIGIVGYGNIGKKVIEIAQAFGMTVLVNTRTIPEGNVEGVSFVDLEALLSESDIISLHCPLTPATENLINKDRLSLMKTSAFLVNTGRGQLIDEAALAAALNEHRIAGAGLDVLRQEPPEADNPLIGADNCFITPHIAWATKSARQRMMKIVADNLNAYLNKQTINQVN